MQDEITKVKKVGRLRRSRELLKSSWQVLRLDKELLALPLIGILVSLGLIIFAIGLVIASFAVHEPVFDVNIQNTANTQAINGQLNWTGYVLLAIFVVAITFISNFIATAIARGALDRFDGQDPTIRNSLNAAKQRAGSIFKFSLLTLTVGVVLSLIRDRVPFAGKVLTWLGDLIWGVATFFVVPVLAMSAKPIGPIDATKQSARIIKKVWGESLIVNIGIGFIALISVVIYAPISVLLTVLAANLYAPFGLAIGLLALLGLFGIVLVFNVLEAIVKAAIYYWATTGKAPDTFNKELLRASLTPKKARKIFAL